jgi:hypothetical protein
MERRQAFPKAKKESLPTVPDEETPQLWKRPSALTESRPNLTLWKWLVGNVLAQYRPQT